MKKVIIVMLCLLLTTIGYTQSKSAAGSSYRTALGVKVWDGGGISFKHFVQDNAALELIGYF